VGLAGVELGEVLSVSEVIGGSGIAPGELELGIQVQVTLAIQ
jgi:hypothetical protein